MSVEEQVRSYMEGWYYGVMNARGTGTWERESLGKMFASGYMAGRAAYLAAEQAERERLERCDNPHCVKEGKHFGMIWVDCPQPDERGQCHHGPGPILGGPLACGAGWVSCPDCHGTGKRRAP